MFGLLFFRGVRVFEFKFRNMLQRHPRSLVAFLLLVSSHGFRRRRSTFNGTLEASTSGWPLFTYVADDITKAFCDRMIKYVKSDGSAHCHSKKIVIPTVDAELKKFASGYTSTSQECYTHLNTFVCSELSDEKNKKCLSYLPSFLLALDVAHPFDPKKMKCSRNWSPDSPPSLNILRASQFASHFGAVEMLKMQRTITTPFTVEKSAYRPDFEKACDFGEEAVTARAVVKNVDTMVDLYRNKIRLFRKTFQSIIPQLVEGRTSDLNATNTKVSLPLKTALTSVAVATLAGASLIPPVGAVVLGLGIFSLAHGGWAYYRSPMRNLRGKAANVQLWFKTQTKALQLSFLPDKRPKNQSSVEIVTPDDVAVFLEKMTTAAEAARQWVKTHKSENRQCRDQAFRHPPFEPDHVDDRTYHNECYDCRDSAKKLSNKVAQLIYWYSMKLHEIKVMLMNLMADVIYQSHEKSKMERLLDGFNVAMSLGSVVIGGVDGVMHMDKIIGSFNDGLYSADTSGDLAAVANIGNGVGDVANASRKVATGAYEAYVMKWMVEDEIARGQNKQRRGGDNERIRRLPTSAFKKMDTLVDGQENVEDLKDKIISNMAEAYVQQVAPRGAAASKVKFKELEVPDSIK
eukprot:jgi/Bigna1/141511/aug1.63_g16219